MKLVPETWLEDLRRSNNSESSQVFEQLPDEHKEDARELLNRARQSGLSLTADNRIEYPSGFVGSNVVDMLKYTLGVANAPRPADSEDFVDALRTVGYSFGDQRTSNESINNNKKTPVWKSLSKRR